MHIYTFFISKIFKYFKYLFVKGSKVSTGKCVLSKPKHLLSPVMQIQRKSVEGTFNNLKFNKAFTTSLCLYEVVTLEETHFDAVKGLI